MYDPLDRLELQDHEQTEPACCCLEYPGDNPACPIHSTPSVHPDDELEF